MNIEQAIKIYGKNTVDKILADKPMRANAWHPTRGYVGLTVDMLKLLQDDDEYLIFWLYGLSSVIRIL